MNKAVYVNTGGFHLIVLNPDDLSMDTKYYLSKSTNNWKYVFIPRRIVTFPTIFKYIVENRNPGKYFVKTYFYEQRDNPLELIIYTKSLQTIYILGSSIPMRRLLKKIVVNPRFSETLIFIAELEDDVSERINKYTWFIKLLNKLYPEIHRIVSSRGFGKVLAIELSESSGLISISICVSQKNVSYKANVESINIDIKDPEQCFY